MLQQEELATNVQTITQNTLKFIRKPNISPELRLHIACTVLYFNDYGTVTRLAKEYQISRTFVYHLQTQLLVSGWMVFGMLEVKSEQEEVSKKLDVVREILSLRLEGKCPILGISQLLKRKGMCNTSIGYISELLTSLGQELSPTISTKARITYGVVFASDEVFSRRLPVLITVDPVSSVIFRMDLAENRKSKSWELHWQSLLDAGIVPLYLTSDEGSGMKAAKEIVFPKLMHQTDTFHALSYHLGEVFRILEEQAYKAIGEEYESYRLLQNAKSEAVKERRTIDYGSSCWKAKDFITLYDDFSFWYEYAIEQFQIFDNKGQLFCPKQARENLELAIQEIESLDWFFKNKNEKMKKIMGTIKNLLPKLFPFLLQAKKVVAKLLEESSCKKETLAIKALCAAYQSQKNRIKTKKPKAKKYWAIKEEETLIVVQILLENTTIAFDKLHKKVYKALDSIVQSSAMVETINSIVRSYFNCSKNQINQAQLNLIKFYHNHRRYIQGKRKGYTPMELLTGKKQEKDWLDLMLAESSKFNSLKKRNHIAA